MRKIIIFIVFQINFIVFHHIPVLADSLLCSYEKIAQIPLRNVGGYIIGEIQINGYFVSVIIDTGSEGSLISRQGAEMLHLTIDPSQQTILMGSKGERKLVQNILVDNMRIGTYDFDNLSIPMGNLPEYPRIKPAIIGLIGGDILSNFDLEFSLQSQKLTLWNVTNHSILCMVPPFWRFKGNDTDLKQNGYRIFTQVKVDHFPLKALIDSGARSKIIAESTVKKMGIHPDMLATYPGGLASAIGSKDIIYHWYQFHSFEMGGLTEFKPILTVSPLYDDADMLIGSDWFAAYEIWISYKRGKLYFIRNSYK